MMKKKGYAKGGKLKMVERAGKKMPFFAADGKGAGDLLKGKKPAEKKAKAPMTKKQQKIAGAIGKAKQYDTGNRDTPASEPVLTKKAKDNAKRQLDSMMGGSRKSVEKKMVGGLLGMGAKGMKKALKSGDMAEIAGSLSPVAGAVSGKGVFGKMRKGLEGLTSREIRELEKKKAQNPEKKMAGGSMKKKGYAKGGSMKKKGYAKGGSICRGMGAATRGGKFGMK